MPRDDLIQLRGGTAAEWEAEDPVLADREPAWDSTNRVLKVGDGVSPWSTLVGIAGDAVSDDRSPLVLERFNEIYGDDITIYDQEFDRTNEITLPTGWSWVNQGTASYVERFGAGALRVPNVANAGRMIARSIPSESTWVATMFASAGLGSAASGDIEFLGIALRQSSNGKTFLMRRSSTNGVITTRYDDLNGLTAGANVGTGKGSNANGIQGFRVSKIAADSYNFEYSADGGISWVEVDMARAIAFHLTPDQIGFVAYNGMTFVTSYAIHSFRVR